MEFRNIAGLVCILLFSCSNLFAQAEKPPSGLIRRIEFIGLRRISPDALRPHLTSHEGQLLDAARVAADVRALDRLGWFENVRVEAEPLPVMLASTAPGQTALPAGRSLRLVFTVEERPFLAKVEFRGSSLLPRERINALLAEQRITLKLAAPVNDNELWHARRVLERALAEQGYPRARIQVLLEPVPTAAVRAVFLMDEGPRVHVAEVLFTGNLAFSEKELRRQMKTVTPHEQLARLRGKTIYTVERLSGDLRMLEEFYRNHGYPDAQLGEPRVESIQQIERRWLPRPRTDEREALRITIPVEEGPFFRVQGLTLDGFSVQTRARLESALHELKPDQAFSQEKVLRVRDRLERLAARANPDERRELRVEAIPEFDREAGTVRMTFRLRDSEPILVRRIEFTGHHRFSDRYFRSRILLREGDSLDLERLDRGLAQLARTGFIKPVAREDVDVRVDEGRRVADITIHFQEAGRQRVSLVGGAGVLGNTLGVAYNVFDLLGGEELITAHLEGGPASLQMLLGIAKESIFGTRASLGLSLFQNIIRPNLPGASGRSRLFTSRSGGFSLNGEYPLNFQNSLGLSYQFSRDSTQIHVPAQPGVTADALRTQAARRALELTWTHNSGETSVDAATSVAGGWLGGDEKLVRSSLEFAHIHADPLTHGRNAWAWRGVVAGASSFDGRPLALHQRLFGGEQLLRGFRTGEIAPYVATSSQNPDGATVWRAQSGGANLLLAANAEYRVPLDLHHVGAGLQTAPATTPPAEIVGFFDTGAGWLLPRWLGGAKPQVVGGTNGVLRASTGIEARVELPVVRQTLRVHYAVNPLRLVNALLPDGSPFRLPDRRSALGWALGTFF